MKLDYIYHSGFAIEADGVTVIIDYYKDSSEEVFNKGIVHDYLLEKPGVLYVLCSHFHPDHFNREVLSWKNRHKAQRKAKFYINKCRSASCMQSGLKQASA